MKFLWSDPDTLHWPTWTSIFLELNPFSLEMHSLLLINITQGFTGFRIRFLTKWLYQNHTLKRSKYVIVCWKQKHIHTCHVPKLECSRYRLTWILLFETGFSLPKSPRKQHPVMKHLSFKHWLVLQAAMHKEERWKLDGYSVTW